MDATTSSSKTSSFIAALAADYPQFEFTAGVQEHWSPKTNTITYVADAKPTDIKYGLLHELAHALLGHTTYRSDFELLKLEAQAWQMAASIGSKYGLSIDQDHIQDCLDTYRDWLHRRSRCPACGVHALQSGPTTYKCYNCANLWQVSSGRFSRPYRKNI